MFKTGGEFLTSDPHQLQRQIRKLEQRITKQHDEIRKLHLIHQQLQLRLDLLEHLINEQYRQLENLLGETIINKKETNRYLM